MMNSRNTSNRTSNPSRRRMSSSAGKVQRLKKIPLMLR